MSYPSGKRRGFVFGHNKQGDEFFVSPAERKKHMHVVGASGMGKSKFLEMLIRQDLANAKVGGCVIDPHGLLVDDIMNYVSHHKPQWADKIILFEPDSQTDSVIGFNPIPQNFDNVPQAVAVIVENILFAWGEHKERLPRIRTQLFNILYPILENDLTLAEALPMVDIHARKMRENIVRGVSFPPVVAAWETFERLSSTAKLQLLEGPGNRLMGLLANEHMRVILSQKKNALDLRRIMDEGKMVLISLRDYNRLGWENLRMLGVMILAELFRVGMQRDERKNPRPFHVYIDEFGEYVTPAVAAALDQIRKKNIFFTVAHQHLAQLETPDKDQRLIKSVLTNCRLKVAFGGMETEDAERISRLMWTPHIDLKEVKHEQEVTKERTVEELRATLSFGRSMSEGTQETESYGTNWGKAVSKAYTDTTGWGLTETDMKGWSTADSLTFSQQTGKTQSVNHQINSSRGTQVSDSTGGGDTESQSVALGKSKTDTRTDGQSATTGKAVMVGESKFRSHAVHQKDEASGKREISISDGLGENASTTTSESTTKNSSVSIAKGESEVITDGKARNTNYNHSRGQTEQEGVGLSLGQGHSQIDGLAKGKTATQSGNKSYAQARSAARAEMQGTSENEGGSEVKARGANHSEGTNTGFSISPFSAKYEYKEVVSTSHWSHTEQLFRKLQDLMKLETGCALMSKDASIEPQVIKIPFIRDVRWFEGTSQERLEETEERIRESNPEYYAPRYQVLAEAEARQNKLAEEPMLLDEQDLDNHSALEAQALGDEPKFNTQ